MLIHFTYIFLNITIALTYIHYLIDNLSNMHALNQYLCMYTFFTCMILTQQIAKIQTFISEQGAFPFVIVWVQQWGAWKQAPM